jgi:hypothetical protein
MVDQRGALSVAMVVMSGQKSFHVENNVGGVTAA